MIPGEEDEAVGVDGVRALTTRPKSKRMPSPSPAAETWEKAAFAPLSPPNFCRENSAHGTPPSGMPGWN
jgi:hypothetical protein